jgi:hypothetical protein
MTTPEQTTGQPEVPDGQALRVEGNVTVYGVTAAPVGDRTTVISRTLKDALSHVEMLFDDPTDDPGPVEVLRMKIKPAEVDGLREFQGY